MLPYGTRVESKNGGSKPALRTLVFLRIVGSGICPMVRGLPRAMLAPDASVGKVETYASTIGCVLFEKQVIALLCRVWYN